MYLSPRLPLAKVRKNILKFKDTKDYDGAVLQYLKSYFKFVLLADKEKESIEESERQEWVKAYADIAFMGISSKYWEHYKAAFEEILGLRVVS